MSSDTITVPVQNEPDRRVIDISLEDDSELRPRRATKVYQCLVQTCTYASTDPWAFARHQCPEVM